MLNVTAQRSAQGAKSYFAHSDYYAEGQEMVGNWGGRGAALLGLRGEVDRGAFEALCDNRDPRSGGSLTPVTRGDRRVGYDFTWSAPKSVSVVHALTGDQRIVEAFRSSVGDTMAEMERDMQARVRRGGADEDRTTGNMAWAEFVHLTSRPVDGVPCPQLHAHCFAFNSTYDAVESRWKAGNFGKIKGDGYYWQAVQQARFADRLQGLGYAVRRTKDAFEIAGVPDGVLKRFSLRTQQIEAAAERLGITDPKAKARLGATTREAKAGSIAYPELVQRWAGQLSPAERRAVAATRGQPRAAARNDAEHARYAADHLFERSSVVAERRLLALALKHGLGEVTPEGVRSQANRLGLLKREDDGQTLVTTAEVLGEERRMLQFAARGKGTCAPICRDSTLGDLDRSRLSGEQRAAVRHVLTSPDRVMILRGVAGSGKTTLTQEAVRHMEAAGRPVVMLAPSAQASRGVLRSEGFAGADTLARFLVDEKMQAAATHGVIWLDEAGLVGTRTLAKLFDLAGPLNARVVLAGDKRQLASVERGAALRVLEDVAGLPIAEVTDIRRQAGQYKEAVKLLSVGKSDEALAQLDDMGWVKTMPDGYGPVAADYVEKFAASPDPERGVLIVCPTHAEGARATDEVRRQLRERGKLGTAEREFTRLVPLQWTEAERGDAAQYAGDEVLQFHRNTGSFKAGERATAADAFAAARPPKAGHFAAYRTDTIHLAAGDLIRVTANGKSKDGQHKLNNGAVYAVAGFTRGGDIRLGNGWVVDKSFGTFGHGYVSTAHAAQGRTVDHVIGVVSSDSYPATSREGFYVLASRGRRSLSLYTDDKAGLRSAVQRSSPRLSATELAARPRPPWASRLRDRMARMRVAALVAAKATVPAAARQTERERQAAHAR